jgi:hypothetical protein
LVSRLQGEIKVSVRLGMWTWWPHRL